jgi:hypothetical protein
LHRDLAAELAVGDGGHMSLLTKSDGSAVDANSLGIWFADAIGRAGLAEACVMHGLRKTAARALAEAGCTAHQIASITGHKCPDKTRPIVSIQTPGSPEISIRTGTRASSAPALHGWPGTGSMRGLVGGRPERRTKSRCRPRSTCALARWAREQSSDGRRPSTMRRSGRRSAMPGAARRQGDFRS